MYVRYQSTRFCTCLYPYPTDLSQITCVLFTAICAMTTAPICALLYKSVHSSTTLCTFVPFYNALLHRCDNVCPFGINVCLSAPYYHVLVLKDLTSNFPNMVVSKFSKNRNYSTSCSVAPHKFLFSFRKFLFATNPPHLLFLSIIIFLSFYILIFFLKLDHY